jgi:DNA-binding NtrC family response regulator
MPERPIRLIVVDDEPEFRSGLCERLRRKGYETFDSESGEKAVSLASGQLLDVAIVDIRMPGMDGIELLTALKSIHPSIEVIILTGAATVDTALEAMKLGAYDYLSKPCKFEKLNLMIEKACEKKRLGERTALMERELNRIAHSEFIGVGGEASEINRFIELAAQADCPVLIEGESGVGKELVAREIHRRSPRAAAPFVALDCGSSPEALLADELFGHERGAFTTAMNSRQGLLEIADGGTLLMDEIGEMTPANQTALLRVVETKNFRRIGGSTEMSVDVRVIASTNRNLRDEIAAGAFRQDLFYRLEVMHYTVPPLRSRKEDIPLLAEYFLSLLNRSRGTSKTIRAEDVKSLEWYDWPGNIRELANLVERGFFLSTEEEIPLADFARPAPGGMPPISAKPSHGNRPLSDVEREHILNVLAAKNWNKKQTAITLKISRSRLYNLISKYGISTPPK